MSCEDDVNIEDIGIRRGEYDDPNGLYGKETFRIARRQKKCRFALLVPRQHDPVSVDTRAERRSLIPGRVGQPVTVGIRKVGWEIQGR